ncbi:signal peptidase I [Amnibacterium flavum]|uniref:signal peptidase I n=1 Tax=Amnibacterium flavum TaxID=2173173 RepID=UPI001403B7C9|nr:signal peptidase I [Amnibacterium flavum]
MRKLNLIRWIAIGILAAALVVPAGYLLIGGRTVVAIDGGSMMPTFYRGSVVIDGPVADEDLAVGMMVTVKDPGGTYFTHRIVSIDAEGGLHLKGDANEFADDTVRTPDQVVGQVETVLPAVLGGILIQLQEWPMRLSLLVTALGLALLPLRRETSVTEPAMFELSTRELLFTTAELGVR